MSVYPRDMLGYGSDVVDAQWPGDAAIAVQFVLNYEEGGENNILHGDKASEAFLSEIVGADAWPGQRHWNMESIYEYGARAGFWRLHRLFTGAGIPVTVFGVATALQRSPEQVQAMLSADWEIASHGWKWIDYKDFSKDRERDHMERAIRLHTDITGSHPRGWYTGRCSVNTVDLVAENGGFAYTADSYADDLPYWHHCGGHDQLVVPYTLDANDMRFATSQGFNSGDQFYGYLRDSFDVLYAEGLAGAPKMMSIGLHCRLAGRPGRQAALARFIDHVRAHDRVWLARRVDIADHWAKVHPPVTHPASMTRFGFVSRFGGVFEHSPWVAEDAWQAGLNGVSTAEDVHAALCRAFRAVEPDARLAVLRAHPDLAGRLAAAKRLTAESTSEQASAGLDVLTDDERSAFQRLNARYTERFGFPFIIAVRGLDKSQILNAFQTRIENETEVEFDEACKQVERIAGLRLADLLPEGAH